VPQALTCVTGLNMCHSVYSLKLLVFETVSY
jgi:hypothetical protein